jgi:hypothetical protein
MEYMNAIQQQPSLPAPIVIANPIVSWWTSLQCQKAELSQNLGSQETGKIYRAAWWKTAQIFGQISRLLMLIGLSIVGFFVGLWLLCFYQGLKLRQDLEVDEPTPQNIVWKLLSVLILDPLDRFTKWLKASLKKEFNWDL